MERAKTHVFTTQELDVSDENDLIMHQLFRAEAKQNKKQVYTVIMGLGPNLLIINKLQPFAINIQPNSITHDISA